MSLHSKDWLKLGLGAALLAATGGLAGIGIPGLLGAEGAAGAAGAGAAGAEALGTGAAAGETAALTAGEGSLASSLAGTGAAAGGQAAAESGLGHALTQFGLEAGKDAAKGTLVAGMMSPLTRQTATVFGQPLQMPQQQDIMSLFPRQG